MNIKKIALILSFLFILSIITLAVWLNLPSEEANLTQLVLPDAFALVSLRLGPKEAAGYLNFIGHLNSNAGLVPRLKILAAKPIVAYFSPLDILIIGVLEPDSDQAAYLVIARNSRLAKLAGLIARLRLRRGLGEESGYRIFKDALMVSKKSSLLGGLGKEGKGSIILNEDPGSAGVFIFAQNKDLLLSKMIKRMEQKSSYSIFPSIDSVGLIKGRFNIFDSGRAAGNLIFYFKDKAGINGLDEDVSFLAIFIRRFFKAEGLNFSSEIKRQDDSVSLAFDLCRKK